METPKPETTRNSIDVFEHLLTRARNTPMDQLEQRWHLLEAAHIVGQTRFEPHLRVHVAMLNLA